MSHCYFDSSYQASTARSTPLFHRHHCRIRHRFRYVQVMDYYLVLPEPLVRAQD